MRLKIQLILGLIGLSLSIWAAPPTTLEGWNLVFEDEFTGTSLDRTKWNPTYNWGSTHNHRAYCAPENVMVEDGKLRLKGEARRHPSAPATTTSGGNTYSLDYTSGAIDTRNKFSTQYGYIEGRFKAPPQRGTWPAFWMLQDGWPPEIDILEIPHARNQHHYYLHYTQPDWYAQHGSAWDHEASFGGVHSGPDKAAAFYNYGVEWDANSMNFYFNDQRIASYSRPTEISQTKAMYIIVNLAIGGWATSGGDPIEVTSTNPAYFEAEWIRAWTRKASVPTRVRLMSVASGKCMIPVSNKVMLGNCRDSSAFVNMVSVGGSTYRVNFGNQVLEIPNESTSPGAAAGIWGWNGNNHQRVVFEPQTGFTGTVVRLKMLHSNHYLRMADSAVIQDWNTSWPWNQNWRVVTNDSELPPEEPVLVQQNSPYTPSILKAQGSLLYLTTGSRFNQFNPLVRVISMKGQTLESRKIKERTEFETSQWPRGVYRILIGTGMQVEAINWVNK